VLKIAARHIRRNRTYVKEGKNEPVGKKVRNLLTHEDILLHQSQKEFISCDLAGGKFK
jgi:hypothetical protein